VANAAVVHLSYQPALGGAGNAFFSEEKKQKTFATSDVCAACKVRDSIKQKSFGSFLQKRTSSLDQPQ